MEGQICMDWDGVSHISTLWVQDNQCHCILCYTYTWFSVKKLKFILSSPHHCAWQGAGCAQVPLYSKERDRHFCHVGSVGLSFFFFFQLCVTTSMLCTRRKIKGHERGRSAPQWPTESCILAHVLQPQPAALLLQWGVTQWGNTAEVPPQERQPEHPHAQLHHLREEGRPRGSS